MTTFSLRRQCSDSHCCCVPVPRLNRLGCYSWAASDLRLEFELARILGLAGLRDRSVRQPISLRRLEGADGGSPVLVVVLLVPGQGVPTCDGEIFCASAGAPTTHQKRSILLPKVHQFRCPGCPHFYDLFGGKCQAYGRSDESLFTGHLSSFIQEKRFRTVLGTLPSCCSPTVDTLVLQ